MVNFVLITGIPGAGKSTISKELAKSTPQCAYISGDDLRLQILGGYANPAKQPWTDETRKQYYLSFENAALLAKNYLKNGYKVVVDHVIHAGDLFKEWNKHVSNIEYFKVFLNPDINTVIERNRTRGKFVQEEVIKRLKEDYLQYDYSDWFVIDNGKQSITESVSLIKSKIGW